MRNNKKSKVFGASIFFLSEGCVLLKVAKKLKKLVHAALYLGGGAGGICGWDRKMTKLEKKKVATVPETFNLFFLVQRAPVIILHLLGRMNSPSKDDHYVTDSCVAVLLNLRYDFFS